MHLKTSMLSDLKMETRKEPVQSKRYDNTIYATGKKLDR